MTLRKPLTTNPTYGTTEPISLTDILEGGSGISFGGSGVVIAPVQAATDSPGQGITVRSGYAGPMGTLNGTLGGTFTLTTAPGVSATTVGTFMAGVAGVFIAVPGKGGAGGAVGAHAYFSGGDAGGVGLTAALGGNAYARGGLGYGGGANGSVVMGDINTTSVVSPVVYATNAGAVSAVLIQADGTMGINGSDARLKANVRSISDVVDPLLLLEAIRGVYFNWDTSVPFNSRLTGEQQVGVIAQEIQAVLPEIVKVNESTPEEYLTVNYELLAPILIEVCKSLKARIALAKARYQALISKNQ